MSNFKIVHEIDGRLRVRFGQYAFTNEQATILKSDFLKLEYVRYVEAHYKNGSLLLVFDENYKNEVFGYLKSYDLSYKIEKFLKIVLKIYKYLIKALNMN